MTIKPERSSQQRQSTKMKSHEDQEEEEGDNIDVIGLVKGENDDGKTKLKERLNKNLKN